MPNGTHVAAMMGNPDSFYGDLLPRLRDADLRLVNVECVIGEAGGPVTKNGPNLRADPRTIASLRSVPFDVACLANNHVLDFGPGGLASTIEELHGAGIATVGAGLNGGEAARPYEARIHRIPVAVISCAEGEASRSVNDGPGAHGFDMNAIRVQLAGLKENGNVVIVVYHGGREYVPVPPPYVVHALRAVAEMGADVVIGHHPHVPQGVELHAGVPIAYSLGNFAFNFSAPRFYCHVGYLLQVDFLGRHAARVEAIPYLIGPKGLSLLKSPAREAFDRHMARATAVLATESAVWDAWDAVADYVVTPELVRRRFARAVEAIDAVDPRGIADLANMFFTPAHCELLSRGLARMACGRRDTAPRWARELLDHCLNYRLDEALAAL
jgi:poly-gamma-glutamate synthesis protein (capsule biosynthesis protein)